jgi:predicted AAA+ superfamily ATPase
MITINKPIKIPDNDIFRNDLLDREETIKDLSNLIVSDIQPFVFSVNADWGAGKTTFIKLWQAHLKESHKVKSIYFSAWEDDFTSDPLIAILGELNVYFEKKHRSNSSIKIIRGLPSSISFNISSIEFLNFSKVVFSF